jgi:hypothetical protein
MKHKRNERRLCGAALRKLQLLAAYHLATFYATVFGKPFWIAEQWRARLWDQLQNEGFWR